jgi:hypothetical protein
MWRRISRSAVWLGGLGAVAVIATVGIPLASASPSSHGPSARSAGGASGLVFGGRTSQGWPVVIELSRNRRQVAQAVIGIRLPCTTGRFANLPDRYVRLPVNRRRKFSSSFGPETFRNDDGTTSDFEGSISGSFNRARTRASGRWQLKITDHDNSGAVTGTCDSGSVSWSAKQ